MGKFAGGIIREAYPLIYEEIRSLTIGETREVVANVEFASLDSLGLIEFTEEQVLCFISNLKGKLGELE